MVTILTQQLDLKYMGESVRNKLDQCGKDSILFPMAKIVKPQVVSIGDNSKIDDFVFIYGGEKVKIGDYCHVASFSSIIGGGEFEMGHCSVITAGVRIVTGTDRYTEGSLMSTSCKSDWRNQRTGYVRLGHGVFIGTNSVILADVNVGECVVVGANSFVNKDLEPYGIYVGSPAKLIGYRDELKPEILEDLKKEGLDVFKGR